MPTYEEVLTQVLRLTPDEQRQLLKELEALVHRQDTQEPLHNVPKHSIMELEGLGAELWRGIDVDKYIGEERNSWER